MQPVIREIDSSHRVQLLMTTHGIDPDFPVLGITGESPTIEVRRISDGLYLDHDAVADPYWVSSGGTKDQIMTESTEVDGLYFYHFDPVAVDSAGKEQYNFVIRNSGDHSLLKIEHVIYERAKSDNVTMLVDMVSYLYKINVNRLKIDRTANTLTYYDDDQTTPLKVFDLFDINGTPNWKNILDRMPQ